MWTSNHDAFFIFSTVVGQLHVYFLRDEHNEDFLIPLHVPKLNTSQLFSRALSLTCRTILDLLRKY